MQHFPDRSDCAQDGRVGAVRGHRRGVHPPPRGRGLLHLQHGRALRHGEVQGDDDDDDVMMMVQGARGRGEAAQGGQLRHRLHHRPGVHPDEQSVQWREPAAGGHSQQVPQ